MIKNIITGGTNERMFNLFCYTFSRSDLIFWSKDYAVNG